MTLFRASGHHKAAPKERKHGDGSMLSSAEIQAIADDLMGQHERREQFIAFPDRVPTMDDAVKIQDTYVSLLTKKFNTNVAGYKIALTSKSTRDWLKINEPCIGQVLGNRIHQSPHTLSVADYVRFSMETEICVILDRDLKGECSIEEVRKHVRTIHCSYELVEDRAADLTCLDALSLVSDNSWNGGIVIGPGRPADIDLNNRKGRLRVNGKIVKEGTTAETIGGNPLFVISWLAGHLAKRGKVLKAGMPIITGSIIETYFPVPGDILSFDVDDMEPVELRVVA
jgi:2-keto-4-pentenoate hydratase